MTVHNPSDVAEAFEQIEQARRDGFWVAGFASYELGFALEDRLQSLMPEGRRLPLMSFGIYDGPTTAEPLQTGGPQLGEFAPFWSRSEYSSAFQQLHAAIGAGELYQGNLTFPMETHFAGNTVSLYGSLAAYQTVGHGALINLDDGRAILSRSPERFFQVSKDREISTRPMKGTQPRSINPVEDAKLKAFLQSDEKNRAENLMIVDLLRNDISRVCSAGSVHVPKLFEIETYTTVHQMVSEVRGKLRDDATLTDIFRALFPCGSITGAPKIRAMEILSTLEPWPRDIYCGTIGWMAPDGRADFNVAIRTIMIENNRATLNVGGGVVWDSAAESEYEEALWKSRFARCLTAAA
ncbi:MAG: aminodeoxychorismate synthase component I [Paracoccaceae bacterium]|nr:aminodeoxychorismate synthase component I [Paracoccaceae bacterium]